MKLFSEMVVSIAGLNRRLWAVMCLGVLLSAHAWGANTSWLAGFQNKAVHASEHVRAELVVYAPQGFEPGANVWLGLKMVHEPQWHTYWKNPGDVGVATKLTWNLPEGLTSSDVQWPTPQLLLIAENLVDYGYEGTVLLPVQITVADTFQAKDVSIKLRADWLECRIECIPAGGDLALTIPAQQSTVSEVGLFETAWEKAPQQAPDVQAGAQVQTSSSAELPDGIITWTVTGLPASWQGKTLQLLPEQAQVMVNTGAQQMGWDDDVWTASYALSYNRKTQPAQMDAVLMLADGTPDSPGIRISAPVQGVWSAQKTYEIPPSLLRADDVPSQSNAAPLPVNTSLQTTFIGAIALALLGGLLLNLMPCVFPVLSIKALSLAQSGQQSHGAQRTSGLTYALGVIITMLVLAGLLLVLRASGASLGWGFQLQSPLFVSLLAGLFLLIGMNLFGAFEVQVFLPQSVSNIRGQTPALDSFCSGIVSVLVATPCTAPFMGAALGVALALPAWQTLAIFVALGIGLALPLVLIAFIPQLVRLLPRPGAWMVTFRQFMAFPMFATVLWLVWVVSLQTGSDGAFGLLAILLAVALLVWVLGWQQKSLSAPKLWKVLAVGITVVLVLGVLSWFTPALQQKGQVATTTSKNWQVWSHLRVAELQAQGKPVFVNFTAAWCVTCQMNKKTTLSHPDVLQAFADKDVVLLEADWTNNDPEITKELQRLGRSGVPVYAFFWPNQQPYIMAEVLTPNMIYDMLASKRYAL